MEVVEVAKVVHQQNLEQGFLKHIYTKIAYQEIISTKIARLVGIYDNDDSHVKKSEYKNLITFINKLTLKCHLQTSP